MPDRDDFSATVKEDLAKRVGYFCSFPSCGTLTIGPSEEKNNGTSSTGMACHIASAAPGGKRYNHSMTSEERKSIDNGIWMCYKHGKLIDTDENRFTIEILKKWKLIAEKVAQIMNETNCSYDKAIRNLKHSSIASNIVAIDSNGNENELIGDAIHDSCIHIAWGVEIANSIRDFVIEYTRNAFLHGKASNVQFDFKDNRFYIIDDGEYFNPRDMLKKDSKTGGVASIKYLFSQFGQNLILSFERINNSNITTIAIIDSKDKIFEITPCSVNMNLVDIREGTFSINIRETCNEVFIVLPKYFTLSDVGLLTKRNPCFKNETRLLIFVIENLSDNVSIFIKNEYPECQIVRI